MKRSRRLDAIVSNISQSVIADIGCDHALVCIDAIGQGRARKAYACDVKTGPLAAAAANISAAGLSGQIECIQSNGLEKVPADAQQLIIAGMGGRLIIDLLDACPPGDAVVSMILSSHRDTDALRRWLASHAWKVDHEEYIFDGHYYPLLCVSRAAEPYQITEIQAQYGIAVQITHDYLNMLRFVSRGLKHRLLQMPEDRAAAVRQSLDQVTDLALQVQAALSRKSGADDKIGR